MYKSLLYIVLLSFVVAILAYNYTRDNNQKWATISTENKDMLLTGDVIFTAGVSFKSDLVRAFGRNKTSKYSHCGVVLKDSITYIVHMSIDKDVIIQESISEFLQSNRVADFSLYRVCDVIDKKLTEELETLLTKGVEFDNRYDASQNEKLYCTELVCLIYAKLYQINLYPRENRRDVIYPYEIITNKNLRKIL